MKKLFIAALAIALPMGSVFAKDTTAPELAKYNRTGQYETCLTNHAIREMQVLNASQILVKMNGGGAYLAETKNCSGLSKGVALSYDASIDQFCNTTIVHLLDTGSPVPSRGTCAIDRFEKLEKN